MTNPLKNFWEYESVNSTNEQAKELLKNIEPEEGSVIFAHEQTRGRGQRNTVWMSEAGESLTFSLIYFPRFLNAEEQFYLNQVVTLGIIEVFKNLIPSENWEIKWPNDIYVNEGKMGGILIENTLEKRNIGNSVIGVGLNINQEEFPPELPNPVSFYQVSQEKYSLKPLLEKIAGNIGELYQKYLVNKNLSELKNKYEGKLYLKDQWHTYYDGSYSFRGKIVGVTKEGFLVIKTSKEATQYFSLKEISF